MTDKVKTVIECFFWDSILKLANTLDQTEEDLPKSDSFDANDSAIDDLLHDEQASLQADASSDGGPPVKRKKAAKKQPVRDPRTIILGQKADIWCTVLDPKKPWKMRKKKMPRI